MRQLARRKRPSRDEFTTLTKLRAVIRYLRCPGVPEMQHACGKPLGRLSETQFDHIKRCEIEPDNSPENCRPLCLACHDLKTNGRKHNRAGSDKHNIAKSRRLTDAEALHRDRLSGIAPEIGDRDGDITRVTYAEMRAAGRPIQSRGFPTKEERRAVKERFSR